MATRRGVVATYLGIVAIGIVAYIAITQLRGDQGLVAVLAVIWAVSLIGLNVVQGLAGYPSIAQAAFVGIGAYASSILCSRPGWGFVPAAVAAVALGAIAGCLVALIFSRTRGQYFAIGTLFFGAVCTLVATNEGELTGGFNGFPVGLGLSIPTLMIVMAVSLVVGLVIFHLISQSRFGDQLRSIRSDEDLSEHVGVPTATTKAIAIILSAAFGAWAGVLLAQYNGIVAPSQFSFIQGFLMFVAIGIGGYGRLFTPVVGAVIVVGLSQLLKLQPGVSQIALGAMFLLITLLMPGGIIGAVERLTSRSRAKGGVK
jgi:branched-chain amino acid transport system permease protein